jgi:Dyp-type peroxidase family
VVGIGSALWDRLFAGPRYVIAQKYLHDLNAWNARSEAEQGRVIGCTKLENIELPDDLKPANSHVALNTITDADGTERQIVRDNMPFGSVGPGEFGTYFIGYASAPSVIELMLENVFVGLHPATSTGSSTSPQLSPEVCSSCRRPPCSTTCRRPEERLGSVGEVAFEASRSTVGSSIVIDPASTDENWQRNGST